MKKYLLLGILVVVFFIIVWQLVFTDDKNKLDSFVGLPGEQSYYIDDQTPNFINFDYYEFVDDSEKIFFWTDCDNQEFNQFKTLTQQGIMKKRILPGGLEIMTSPNYYQWSKEKFLSFNEAESGAFCGAGGFFPLYADQENLWWLQSCSSGYQPNENDKNYQDFINCQESEEIVRDYFAKK